MKDLDNITPLRINAKFFESNNLAQLYNEDELEDLASFCVGQYNDDYDKLSKKRKQWGNFCKLAANELADKVEYQQDKDTSYKRANTTYPLLSKAAIAFSSYALPAVLQDDQLIKCKIKGSDEGYGQELFGIDGQTPLQADDGTPMKIGKGLKTLTANNIACLLNTQLMEVIPNFEEIIDKTISMLPITGIVFHKVSYCNVRKIPTIDLILPQYLTINEDALSIADAVRITEEYLLSTQKIEEYIRTGTFLDFEYNDSDSLHVILEHHTFLDLDQDGYAEPYIVWIYKESGDILRILPRFTEESVVRDKLNITTAKDSVDADGDEEEERGDIIYIKPELYYIKFGFIPDPNGSIYDIGFGHLLNSISAVVNTNLNQIIDAASIRVKGGGIYSGRLQAGAKTLRIGEWLQASDTTLGAPQLLPLPTAEPPQILLGLLQQLISNAEEMVSISGISVSKLPPNMPATTILAAIEQSTQNYKAILKRVYRGVKELAKTLLAIDKKYLSPQEYAKIVPNGNIEDLDLEGYDLIPYADPDSANNIQNSLKANFLSGMMQDPLMNQVEIRKYILETLNIEDPERFVVKPEPAQPSILDAKQVEVLDAQISQIQAEIENKKQKLILEAISIDSQNKKDNTQAIKNLADAESKKTDSTIAKLNAIIEHLSNTYKLPETINNMQSDAQQPQEQQYEQSEQSEQ